MLFPEAQPMNNLLEIVVIVEGPTEQIFIRDIVTPHLAESNIVLTPIILSKPGQKGGDVKFTRAKNDIERHLKQRRDTYLTLFVDYYGIKKGWPGRDIREDERLALTAAQKAKKVNDATLQEVCQLFNDYRPDKRFIPFIAMYEFEALLFSDPQILADRLHVRKNIIDDILRECREPENINDSPSSAPSKRLEDLSNRFKKTTTGITIAKEIGLAKIRDKCPIFNEWLTRIENLKGIDL
jgi:hypothetical protein